MKINEIKYEWAGMLAKRDTIDMIVLHHAESKKCTAQNIHHWHISNGWSGIGYHYFINKQGEIFKGRPDNVIGSHAKGYNSTSIGVCFEGMYNKEIMPEEQIKAGKELINYLKKKYDISTVKKHCDLNSTDCPGANFPFQRIIGEKENFLLSFQMAATADGFSFPQYGCDGIYGPETQAVMKKCIVKKRLFYKYKNATKLVQRMLGVTQDGLCGKETDAAIRKFQKENGLGVDGSVGEKTWVKLLKI